jgi:hypothetical protein
MRDGLKRSATSLGRREAYGRAQADALPVQVDVTDPTDNLQVSRVFPVGATGGASRRADETVATRSTGEAAVAGHVSRDATRSG